MKFIDTYWEDIHQAAGWRALRAFLMVSGTPRSIRGELLMSRVSCQMLCMNRYLKFEQILKALKHYESKTGMDLWYKDAEVGGGS